jgi:rhodanese-related sulfurtransferase
MRAIKNRRRFIIVLCVFVGLAFFLNPVWADETGEAKFAENVTVRKVYDLMNIPIYDEVKVFLIDVRTQPEFQFCGYIPRAYNIPYYFLGKKFVLADQEFEYAPGEMKKSLINHYPLVKNPDFLKYVKQLVVNPNYDKIIIYGRDSHLSAVAADDLVKAGFKHVMNMLGGLEAIENGWKQAELPLNHMFFIKDLDLKYIYPPDRL